MPKYYEGKEEDRRPCSGLREDLKECLLRSSCVLKEDHCWTTPEDSKEEKDIEACYRETGSVGNLECLGTSQLKECKKGLVFHVFTYFFASIGTVFFFIKCLKRMKATSTTTTKTDNL